MNISSALALTPSPSTDRDCENHIPKVGVNEKLSLENGSGHDIVISILPSTEVEDVEKSRTQSNEHQNAEAGNNVAIHVAVDAAAATAPTTKTMEAKDDPLPGSPDNRRAMYKAATEGDLEAAEILLTGDETLGWIEITEEGDRAIHLAVSGKHTEFVSKLIEKVGWEMLELYDGNGYTACCYAAMAGNVELVRIMMEANPFIANVQNWYGTTPFALAISYGNADIVSYFLRVTEIILPEEQWFNLLLVAIGSKMFDVALIILKHKENLAKLQGDGDRTALHILAQLDISSGDHEKRQALAKNLWGNIQILGKDRVLELMKNPPILHDAAKVGNLDLINMIAYDYPELLSHIDKDGNSIFHLVVMHRNEDILELVKKARNVKNFSAVSLDKDGNNLLHSAGKSIPLKGLKIVGEQDVQMQEAFAWFKAVEEIAPPIYKEMRNKDGDTPTELFWKEHAKMLTTSEKYMKSTSESCMLISTIVLTLVFAAAFAPPGGLNQDTGIPTLLEKKWFASFIVFQVLALSSSTMSIVGFWSIISSNYEQDQFFVLSHYLRFSMCALLLSILFVISAFLSAFVLIFFQERKVLVTTFMLVFYVLLVIGISYQFYKVLKKTYSLRNKSRLGASSSKHKSLWSRIFSCVPIYFVKS